MNYLCYSKNLFLVLTFSIIGCGISKNQEKGDEGSSVASSNPPPNLLPPVGIYEGDGTKPDRAVVSYSSVDGNGNGVRDVSFSDWSQENQYRRVQCVYQNGQLIDVKHLTPEAAQKFYWHCPPDAFGPGKAPG